MVDLSTAIQQISMHLHNMTMLQVQGRVLDDETWLFREKLRGYLLELLSTQSLIVNSFTEEVKRQKDEEAAKRKASNKAPNHKGSKRPKVRPDDSSSQENIG